MLMPSLHLPSLRLNRPAEQVEALLMAGKLDGDTLTVSRADWERIRAQFEMPRISLGAAVDNLAAKRAECFDADGKIIAASPCDERHKRNL
jgi:hypothetical protein